MMAWYQGPSNPILEQGDAGNSSTPTETPEGEADNLGQCEEDDHPSTAADPRHPSKVVV